MSVGGRTGSRRCMRGDSQSVGFCAGAAGGLGGFHWDLLPVCNGGVPPGPASGWWAGQANR